MIKTQANFSKTKIDNLNVKNFEELMFLIAESERIWWEMSFEESYQKTTEYINNLPKKY